jgi:hypothetical protein
MGLSPVRVSFFEIINNNCIFSFKISANFVGDNIILITVLVNPLSTNLEALYILEYAEYLATFRSIIATDTFRFKFPF